MSNRVPLEAYWAQTRRKWEGRVANPYGSSVVGCGFCRFSDVEECGGCPVVRVYGCTCGGVESVRAYDYHRDYGADVEKLGILAKAVVRELDERKAEFIEAMRELREVQNDSSS